MAGRDKTGKFLPGHKAAKGGRPEGSKNQKTQMWEELGEYLINDGAKRYLNHLRYLPDKDFAQRFEALLEYFKPKLSRREQVDTQSDTLEGFVFQIAGGEVLKELEEGKDEAGNTTESETG